MLRELAHSRNPSCSALPELARKGRELQRCVQHHAAFHARSGEQFELLDRQQLWGDDRAWRLSSHRDSTIRVSLLWSPPLVEPAPRGRALDLEEWLALGEDEPGELVHGHLEDEEVPDAVHELAVTWLAALLRAWLGSTGFVLGSEVKLVLANTGRKPDLSVYLPGRKPPPAAAL